jgi:chromosomal replication initiation ATPase DnaA
VLVDPADSGPLGEQGLFHLINAVRSGGTQLLLTARRFAPAWGVRLPDLASRRKAAATVEIHEPDDELLAAVVTKLFADRQVEVEPHVVQFLVRRMERSLSTAIAVVDRLDRAALESKTRITRTLAAQTMNAMDEGQGELGI